MPETHGTGGGRVGMGVGALGVGVLGGTLDQWDLAQAVDLFADVGIHPDIDIATGVEAHLGINQGIVGGGGLNYQILAVDGYRLMAGAGFIGGTIEPAGAEDESASPREQLAGSRTLGPYASLSFGVRSNESFGLYIDNRYEYTTHKFFPDTHWWLGTFGAQIDASDLFYFSAEVGLNHAGNSRYSATGMHYSAMFGFRWGDGGNRRPAKVAELHVPDLGPPGAPEGDDPAGEAAAE